MELLQAEINRKRKATEDLLRKSNEEGATGLIGKTKFILQSALAKAKEKEREENQRKLDEERAKARRDGANTKIGLSPDVIDDSVHKDVEIRSDNSIESFSVEVVKARLRNAGQPTTLFGETDAEREKRLLSLESKKALADDADEFRLQSAYAQDNSKSLGFDRTIPDDGGRDDCDDDFDEDERPDREESNRRGSGTNQNDDGEGSDDDDSKDGSRTKVKELSAVTNYGARKGLSDEKIVYKYFRHMLKLWEWDLNARDDRDKLTAKGKMETKTQKQCKDYIRPLFKLCKRRELSPDILMKLVGIVRHCEEGNFRAAHDLYLQTAIGNAAWPIGLTMVGIHERSGREKISTSKVAHVMNNELQRKYLTSVKRLMTFVQTKRDDIPPSMKVL
jgi:pre-mRNA-splicing factor 18